MRVISVKGEWNTIGGHAVSILWECIQPCTARFTSHPPCQAFFEPHAPLPQLFWYEQSPANPGGLAGDWKGILLMWQRPMNPSPGEEISTKTMAGLGRGWFICVFTSNFYASDRREDVDLAATCLIAARNTA